jgi:hypothetical protein
MISFLFSLNLDLALIRIILVVWWLLKVLWKKCTSKLASFSTLQKQKSAIFHDRKITTMATRKNFQKPN